MTKTKPPCFDGESDCPKRHVGCREDCDAWQKWLVIHAEEHEKMQRNKNAMLDVDRFLVGQNKRAQKKYREDHAKAVRDARRK